MKLLLLLITVAWGTACVQQTNPPGPDAGNPETHGLDDNPRCFPGPCADAGVPDAT